MLHRLASNLVRCDLVLYVDSEIVISLSLSFIRQYDFVIYLCLSLSLSVSVFLSLFLCLSVCLSWIDIYEFCLFWIPLLECATQKSKNSMLSEHVHI